MSVTFYLNAILKELSHNQQFVMEEELQELCREIRNAGHIFTAGVGRSGAVIRAFTNRLLQLGLSVSMVGEISSPHSKPDDLLIICSGSGETDSLVSLAGRAKRSRVRLALITIDRRSSIAKLADTVVILPGVSPKLEHQGLNIPSIQPMGSAFEQLSFLMYDSVILELMEQSRQSGEEMFERHADFE